MKNKITLTQAIALYMSAILGSGILFLSATTASIAGPASIIAWVIMVILSFPLAYTFASLSKAYPDAGGAATFTRKAFGPHSGNVVGWFYFITAAVGQIIVSLTGATYISNAFHFNELQTMVVASIILLISGISNHFGLRVSGKLSLILSSLLLIILLVTAILSLPYIQLKNFSPFLPHGYSSIGVSMIMIFWSFFGWEAICNLADRFEHPEKNMIKSTMISAVIIGIIFITFSFITIGTATYGDLESNLAPIGVMMDRSLGMGAKMVMAILAFIVCTGTVNAFVASLAQLGYALSRDGAFPKWLFHLNPQTHSATRVVWVVILFALGGVLFAYLFQTPYHQLLFIPNSLGLIVYLISMLSGMRLFRRGTTPWFTSLFSLIILAICLPFLGFHLWVPIIVIIMYGLFWINAQRGNMKQHSNQKIDK